MKMEKTHVQEIETPGENEDNLQELYSNFKILVFKLKSRLSNEYVRFKNRYQKPYPTLDYRDT